MLNFRNQELEFVEECVALSLSDLNKISGREIVEDSAILCDKLNTLRQYIFMVSEHVKNTNPQARVRNIFDLIKHHESDSPEVWRAMLENKYSMFKSLLAENSGPEMTFEERRLVNTWARLGRSCYESALELLEKL